MTGAFNFRENWPHGLQLYVTTSPLLAPMCSADEIETQLKALRTDLDSVERRMIAALASRPTSVFGGNDDA